MNVLIVEDEPAAVRHLCRLLTVCDRSINVLESLDSIESTVNWLDTNTDPDLIFMDIQLTDGVSFEIFKRVEVTTPIIFCTAYDEYAIDAFKVNSIDYLLKPLDENALCESLSKFNKFHQQPMRHNIDFDALLKQLPHLAETHCSRLLVKTGRNYHAVSCDEIACINIQYKIVSLITLEGKSYTLEHTLDNLEDMLDKDKFFRVNRQTIVSISGICRVMTDDGRLNIYLTTSDTKPIIVSRDKSTLFKNWMGN